MSSDIRQSITLPSEVIAVLDTAGAELGISRSEIMRRAVVEYAKTREVGTYSLSRIAEVVEYTQILLQHHVIHDDADKHDAIVNVLDQRLIEHHGR